MHKQKKQYPTIRTEHYYLYIEFLVEFGTDQTGIYKANTLMLQHLGLAETDRQWLRNKLRIAHPYNDRCKTEYRDYFQRQTDLKYAKYSNTIDADINSDRLTLEQLKHQIEMELFKELFAGELNLEQKIELFFRTLTERRKLTEQHLDVATFALEYTAALRQLQGTDLSDTGHTQGHPTDDEQDPAGN